MSDLSLGTFSQLGFCFHGKSGVKTVQYGHQGFASTIWIQWMEFDSRP